MADTSQQNRTEAATPRKRQQARKKGQVARSTDLSVGLVLLAGGASFWLAGEFIGGRLMGLLRNGLLNSAVREITVDTASTLISDMLQNVLILFAPILAAVVVFALLANLGQTGILFSMEAMQPDLEKLSPIKGWTKLFSMKAALTGGFVVIKAACGVCIAWWIISSHLPRIAKLGQASLITSAAIGWEIILQCVLALAGALVMVGLVDYIYQYWKHEEDLKMTKQEVRDEMKQDNGDPEMKSRMRKLQREMTQRKMLGDVPDATVILTNPTHYAVALRYRPGIDQAPTVIAKGGDHLAKRIIKIAKEAGVPVVERKPLARALFAAVEVGGEVPMEMYQAVAEIIWYVQGISRAA